MLDTIIKVCAAISALAAVIVLVNKLYHMWLPGRAELSCKLVFDGSEPDSISVKVINKSRTAFYVRSCTVRSTYSIYQLMWRHVKKPFLSPRLYPNLRYSGAAYQFIHGDPVRLEPAEMKEFRIEIFEHPLNAVFGPLLIANVLLTTGQNIRSRRLKAPLAWRFIGQRNR